MGFFSSVSHSVSYSASSSAKTSVRRRRPTHSWDISAIDSSSKFEESTITSVVQSLPSPNLKIKKVDHFFSGWTNKWKYKDSGSNVIPELRSAPADDFDDGWEQYCFVVIREIPKTNKESDGEQPKPYFLIRIKSPYLRKACKDVIGDTAGIWWSGNPLELNPQLLLTFLPRFKVYRDSLTTKELNSEESYIRSTVDVLINYLRTDYRTILASIHDLKSQGLIKYEYLFGIFVPGSIILTSSFATAGLEALKLISSTEVGLGYQLRCESVDLCCDRQNVYDFGWVTRTLFIPRFDGSKDITELNAYPIEYHPHEQEIRRSLIARGRKWAQYSDGNIHHLQYNGTASANQEKIKWNVNSRVIIDRANFERHGSGATLPHPRVNQTPIPQNNGVVVHDPNEFTDQPVQKPQWVIENISDDECLLASQIIRGFNLSDKLWMEFNIDNISPIEWNDTAFSSLVLPADRKKLLQSLIEAHNMELGFDDFIKGKGKGLVVNLFGPPGVGKTLTAEATCEHVKRPLYVVGAGELGTDARELDQRLKMAFELATAWKAIILIDEADVFLEQRGLHDLKRNAMVAVFLRHLEYYPAILFLTTNRVKVFDEAFLSRIHIALHFQELSAKARAEVWTAFLSKLGIRISAEGGVSEEELDRLANRDINGRQVKNATKTAQYLAVSRGEKLQFKHLTEVLDVMEQFSADFAGMRRNSDKRQSK